MDVFSAIVTVRTTAPHRVPAPLDELIEPVVGSAHSSTDYLDGPRLERVHDGSVTMDVVHDAPVPAIVPGSAGH